MVHTKRPIRLMTIAGMLAWVSLAGCDRPPSVPKTADREKVKVLSVSPAERGELKAATALETARVNYLYRLGVLQAYYENVGNMDKFVWTGREIKNLDTTMTFDWAGLPEITAPKGETVVEVDEQVLVEYVVAARAKYMDTDPKEGTGTVGMTRGVAQFVRDRGCERADWHRGRAPGAPHRRRRAEPRDGRRGPDSRRRQWSQKDCRPRQRRYRCSAASYPALEPLAGR